MGERFKMAWMPSCAWESEHERNKFPLSQHQAECLQNLNILNHFKTWPGTLETQLVFIFHLFTETLQPQIHPETAVMPWTFGCCFPGLAKRFRGVHLSGGLNQSRNEVHGAVELLGLSKVSNDKHQWWSSGASFPYKPILDNYSSYVVGCESKPC